MGEPLISVIVPTYNRAALLRRTLASILEQSYTKIETIVVNDAGEYPLVEGLDVMAFYSSSQDKVFNYFENKENKGLAGTRNVAMSFATGDYFVFLDDDDILLPYALEFRMYMMKKLNAEIVYTRALQDIWEKREQGYVSVHKKLYWDSLFHKDLILIQNIAPCCCPMFSRKAWNDSGNHKFDEEMTTSEDHNFWIELSRTTDFHELKLIDAECSYRQDLTQMTGTLDFSPNWIKIFKRWRHTAIDLDWVTKHQNNILRSAGIDPEEHGL